MPGAAECAFLIPGSVSHAGQCWYVSRRQTRNFESTNFSISYILENMVQSTNFSISYILVKYISRTWLEHGGYYLLLLLGAERRCRIPNYKCTRSLMAHLRPQSRLAEGQFKVYKM